MRTDLQVTIYDAFTSSYEIASYRELTRIFIQNIKPPVYFEIPINNPSVEIPLFALKPFLNTLFNPNIGAIVARLKFKGTASRYKTVDRAMSTMLLTSFKKDNLVKFKTDNSLPYYITKGAIFSADFTPIMLMSWIVNKEEEAYHLVKPIVRIAPSCMLNQADAIQKFIIRKLIPAVLSSHHMATHNVKVGEGNRLVWNDGEDKYTSIKIEIDSFPFKLKTVSPPTIEITDKELLKVASNHIDEIVL